MKYTCKRCEKKCGQIYSVLDESGKYIGVCSDCWDDEVEETLDEDE